MAEMKLAYTSSGVESVAIIDQEGLDSLATWLCYDKEYHYPIEKVCESWRTPDPKRADREFEAQVKDNGGYCNICKSFAGELLSHFDLVRKQVSAE